MGASAEIIEVGHDYTQWMLGGNVVIMLLFINNAIFRGAGNAFMAMYALWIANGLNLILDPILIFGWGPIPAYGVVGAAYATNIGRGIGVAFQLYLLFRGTNQMRIVRESLVVQWSIIRRLIGVSVGGAGQFIIASASWIFLMRIMTEFGDAAIAGYTVSIRVLLFTIFPAWGMANAAATLVGQNLGANQPERAAKSVWQTAFYDMIFLGIVSVIYFLTAETVIGWFLNDQESINLGVMSLKYICIGYVFFAYGMVIGQAFNGAGDTRTPTILNAVAFWGVQIPLAYTLAVYFGLGPKGVFLAIIIAESFLAFIAVYMFRLGRWKTTEI
jgi:putative MATE family efflux protein